MHHYKSRQKQTTNKATKLEHWNKQTNTVDKQRMENAMDKKTGVAHMQCSAQFMITFSNLVLHPHPKMSLLNLQPNKEVSKLQEQK